MSTAHDASQPIFIRVLRISLMELTGEQAGGDGKVYRHGNESSLDRVGATHDAVLGDEEDDRPKSTGETGSDGPGREDRGHALAAVPAPVDAVGADAGDADADDSAHDGVGGRDGQTGLGCDSQVEGRADEGAGHGQHEHGRVVLEELERDDLCADGVGDAGADGHGTGELHDGCDAHGLPHGERPGRDRGRERVGDIIGTWAGGSACRTAMETRQWRPYRCSRRRGRRRGGRRRRCSRTGEGTPLRVAVKVKRQDNECQDDTIKKKRRDRCRRRPSSSSALSEERAEEIRESERRGGEGEGRKRKLRRRREP